MRSRRTAALMYLIAALMFLIAGILGFLGDNRANITFIVLGVAFMILALNAWRSTDGSDES
jgi:positive regulator of sigma E activity